MPASERSKTVAHRSPFAQRGFTLQSIPKETYGRELIEWMAKQGLNRLEVALPPSDHVFGGGKGKQARRFSVFLPENPELSLEGALQAYKVMNRLIAFGKERGVRVVPAIIHLDCSWFHYLTELRPHWRVVGHVDHPSGSDLAQHAKCFRHEEVRAFCHQLVQSVVQYMQPDEVQLWLTEHRMRCLCDKCQLAVKSKEEFDFVADYYRTQAKLYYECIQAARQERPELEMSLWTTQGSAPHNDGLIRSLPKEVLWFYYNGERYGNYNLRPIKTLPQEVQSLRKKGYRLGVQLDWFSCGSFLTTPARICETLEEAAESKMEAACSWVYSWRIDNNKDRGGAHPIMVAGAIGLMKPSQASGAGYERAMAQNAVEAGLSETEAKAIGCAWRQLDPAARTIYLADVYSYWWKGTSAIQAICQRIVTNKQLDEIDQRWADQSWSQTVPSLDQAVESVEKEIQKLLALKSSSKAVASLVGQLKLVAHWGRMVRWVYWAGIVFHRTSSWDTTKGPWRDDRQELIHALQEALVNLRYVSKHHSDNRLVLTDGNGTIRTKTPGPSQLVVRAETCMQWVQEAMDVVQKMPQFKLP